MNRMLAAYIATVTAFSAVNTAFSVVNFEFLPPLLRWLWPTAIGLTGISVWVRHYRKKFYGANVQSKAAI